MPQRDSSCCPAAVVEGSQNRSLAPSMNGNDHRELSLLMSFRPSSTSQSTSESPPMKRSWNSPMTSNGPTPTSTPAGRTEAERPGFLEELAILGRESWRDLRRHTDERAADILESVEPDEITDIGCEAGSREVPPIAAFDSPVLVRGEVHIERDLRVGANGADVGGAFLRRTVGPYKVGDCFGPRARSVPGAEFQHANTTVDVIERRLVEIDWRAARGCAGRRLDHLDR